MKPFSQKWFFDCARQKVIQVFEDGYTKNLFSATRCDDDQAQLASAAPAMARLLLDLEWIQIGARRICPSCDAWDFKGHTMTCPWYAVMQAAGLRR